MSRSTQYLPDLDIDLVYILLYKSSTKQLHITHTMPYDYPEKDQERDEKTTAFWRSKAMPSESDYILN